MSTLQEKDELALNPVPASEKTSWVPPLFNMLGCNIALSALLLGGTLAAGLTLKNVIIASIFGNIVLVLVVMLQGYIGSREGLNTYVLAKGAFGEQGGKWLISLLLAITSFGWFGVQAGIAGQSIVAMFPGIPITPVIILTGAAMTFFAAFGFKTMARLNYIAIPLLVLLMVWGTIKALSVAGGIGMIWSYTPVIAMPMMAAVNLVVGLVIVGAVISPDQLRYTTGMKAVFIVGFGGIAIVSVIQQVAAATMGIAGGSADIASILVGLGFGAVALCIIILAAVTTNVVNAYSGGLAAKTIFPNISRLALTFIAGAIGTFFAAVGITDNFPTFLSILTMFVPSVAGVMWAEYYMIRKMRLVIRDGVNIMAVLAWFAGSGVSFLTTRVIDFGLPPINGIIVSGVVYLILMKLTAKEA